MKHLLWEELFTLEPSPSAIRGRIAGIANGYGWNSLQQGRAGVALTFILDEASLASEIGIPHLFVGSHLFQPSPNNLLALANWGMSWKP
jgi:hypothetical protein